MKTLNELKVLTLDAETYDPHLVGSGNIDTLGPGWRFAMHNKEFAFEVLMFGALTHDYKEVITTDIEALKDLILSHDAIIMHNAPYDLGALYFLFGFEFEELIRDKLIFDTSIMAKCEDNTMTGLEQGFLGKEAYASLCKKRYSLDYLSSKYTKESKSHNDLFDLFYHKSDCFTEVKQQITGNISKGDWAIPKEGTPEYVGLVYRNLKLIMQLCPGKVEEYCLQDIRTTRALYAALMNKKACQLPIHITGDNRISWEDYSNCIKAFTVRAGKGLRVDLAAVRDTVLTLDSKLYDIQHKVNAFFEKEVVLTSPKQLIEAFEAIGIQVPILENNKREMVKSVSKEGLETMIENCDEGSEVHTVLNKILLHRSLKKLHSSYFMAILQQNKYLGKTKDDKWGLVFSDIKIMGAVQTGRCSSTNLNIQQVPKRNPESAKLCRGILYPDEGHQWASCDYSNQEPRLMIHWAALLDAPGVSEIVDVFMNEPTTSLHDLVAAKLNRSKAQTKPITLGLMYGMGPAKLCKTLGYETTMRYWAKIGKEIEVAGPEGEEFLKYYHEMLPFLKFTIDQFQTNFGKNKYLKLISGRYSKLGNQNEVRKAFSKGIQGGSADWTLKAISLCYKEGLEILNAVHDEINIQFKTEAQATKLKELMESAMQLKIPVVAELTTGANWGEV